MNDQATRQRYDAALAGEIELRWQKVWEQREVFRQPNPGEEGFDASRPKFFCMDMFPYPSGAGLHVGHPEGYTATDILCRYKKMRGFNVLHPMGWDAFGLPAEQYAIQTGIHPAQTTRKSIDNFRRQLKRFGFCYDWSREFGTIDEDYYRWTQWIFLRIYGAWYDADEQRARPIEELEREFRDGLREVRYNPDAAEYLGAGELPMGATAGAWEALDDETRRSILDSYRLAYVANQTVNWCPKLGTALANEEVIDGKSERGGFPVFRKPLRQWLFRITAYADRLLSGLDDVDWPASTKAMQTQWIGRSEGAEIDFPLVNAPVLVKPSLRVFTTRPDTIFGATYMVVAPEHPLVQAILAEPPAGADVSALRAYADAASHRSDIERQEAKEKTGVFTGVMAKNPATGEQIPVWTSDYVLMGYGTGAIMAVPGQDERDWEFAEAFDLPIVRTVQPPADFGGKAYTGEGPAINSGSLDGLNVADAKARIIEWLMENHCGVRKVNYRLRDWLFSRQRYWGEPFPIVYDQHGWHHGVGEEALPVVLPPLADYAPDESDDPKPMLAKAEDWVQTTAGEAGVSGLPADRVVTRETNTMPGWAGSCWYHLRYCDPKNAERFVGREAEAYWMGVDRLSEPMHETPKSRRGVDPSVLDSLPDGKIMAQGFVPRDPYPPGEYGPARDLARRARNLPHFDLPDATYFVTWRTKEDFELDPRDRDAVLRSLLHFDDDRCRVYAACVMPDHVHWIVRPFEGRTLDNLVASVKRYSAREVNTKKARQASLWQADRFDHIVRDADWFGDFLRYIAQNPVEAGIAGAPSEYGWTFVHGDALAIDEGHSPGRERGDIGSESRSTQSVDLYIGGAEHAVLHLLYARFWHKVLFDLGEVSTDEPFRKLFHQGLITSFAYQRPDKSLVPVDEVDERNDGRFIERATGSEVSQITAKMSKSLKNVVNPDDVIAEYGADTFRLYEMYMGPLEASKPWNTRDISGLQRFLQRAWRLVIDEDTGEPVVAETNIGSESRSTQEIEKKLHRTIAKAGHDIERLAFNTGIAAMIEFVNTATAASDTGGALTRDQALRFSQVLGPFAPHIAEELWSRLGGSGLVAQAYWPEFDEAMLKDDEVEIPVQIMGKLRAKIMAPADADQKALETLALGDQQVQKLIEGKQVRKVIVVPGRLVNIVAQ